MELRYQEDTSNFSDRAFLSVVAQISSFWGICKIGSYAQKSFFITLLSILIIPIGKLIFL